MSPVPTHDEQIRGLPLPLARLYRNAIIATSAEKRCHAAYYLWEAGLKLLACSALAEYARLQAPGRVLNGRMEESLGKLMLGQWRECVRVLLPALVAAGAGEFESAHNAFRTEHADMPAALHLDAVVKRLNDRETDLAKILAPATGRKLRLDLLFDGLVTHRNRQIGHGAVCMNEDEYYERFTPVLLAGVVEIFGKVCVPTGFRLVHVTRVERLKGREWDINRVDLSGLATLPLPPLRLSANTPHAPEPGCVYFESRAVANGTPVAPDVCPFRPLHPMAVYDAKNEEVLFLNSGLGDSHADYLCYTDNRTVRRNDLRADHHALLCDLLGTTALSGASPQPQAADAPPADDPAVSVLLPVLSEAVRGAPGVTVEAIRGAYLKAAPSDWERVAGGRTVFGTLAAYCRDLARCSLHLAPWPLLKFAQILTPLVAPEDADTVAAAIRSAADLVGVIAPPAEPAAAPDVPAAQNYLLIAIHAEEDRYRVSGWLDAGKPLVGLAEGIDRRYACEDLPAAVDQLRCKAEARVEDMNSLRVEFLLPRALIHKAFDQWDVTLPFVGETAVGAVHFVSVRIPERYRRKEPARNLTSRRKALTEAELRTSQVFPVPPGPPAELRPVVVRFAHASATGSGDDLYFKLLQAPAVVGAVIDEPPPGEPTRSDVLNALLGAGIPVVAWSRGQPAVADEIVRLLTSYPLGELPERLRQLRRDARGNQDPDHAGRNITLLWDDPGRPPPEMGIQPQFRAT